MINESLPAQGKIRDLLTGTWFSRATLTSQVYVGKSLFLSFRNPSICNVLNHYEFISEALSM